MVTKIGMFEIHNDNIKHNYNVVDKITIKKDNEDLIYILCNEKDGINVLIQWFKDVYKYDVDTIFDYTILQYCKYERMSFNMTVNNFIIHINKRIVEELKTDKDKVKYMFKFNT